VIPLAGQVFLSVDVVAERLQISARTLRRLIARGELGVLRISGTLRIPEQEFGRFIAERFTPAARSVRQVVSPETIETILDKAVPRRRGRPKIAGHEGDQ
jgi:excisionase family DNA binding protein